MLKSRVYTIEEDYLPLYARINRDKNIPKKELFTEIRLTDELVVCNVLKFLLILRIYNFHCKMDIR